MWNNTPEKKKSLKLAVNYSIMKDGLQGSFSILHRSKRMDRETKRIFVAVGLRGTAQRGKENRL